MHLKTEALQKSGREYLSILIDNKKLQVVGLTTP